MAKRISRWPTATFRDQRGAALVEFALALPLLLVLIIGILAYGQYFLVAHEVQQAANDAARATLGGLNRTERVAIARDSIAASARAGSLDPSLTQSEIVESDTLLTVTVRHDASGIALLSSPLLPVPDTLIQRRAVVRIGSGT
ncbi:TadE/TadG family type IV pilus assembly protein [Sphingomonas sp. AX6]|uniref:TadE/TadG family type IV pilus assembly protein n=1 Tax=Sphingomonas sp. AX6 TaxID=2653171 RepID=UPI0012EF984E|nr:TadE/TadG family type IV pilus assembly protein [Sphingomonas sp. AX6]VXC73619.1 conserved hypothetical protein [Sphingomonas sp. AX6]